MKILLTGGSRGIGKATSIALRDMGHEVVAPIRSDLNLANIQSINNYLFNLDNDFDVLINNAGVNNIAEIDDLEIQDIHKTMEVNFYAPFLISKHLIKTSFVPRKFGRIVNVGTVWLKIGRKGRASYMASKAALESLTKSISIEYGSMGILCNMISPGIVDTELTRKNNSTTELNKMLDKYSTKELTPIDQVVNTILFLTLSNTGITGENIYVDGGFGSGF